MRTMLRSRSFKLDKSTIALYRFGRGGAEDISGTGLDFRLRGVQARAGALQLPGAAGACAICDDIDRIAEAFGSARGLTVEMWLSSGRQCMNYRPMEEPGAAPASLGWYWGDVVFSMVGQGLGHPLGAVLRYNPDVLFWANVAANGVEHIRGHWFRSVGYLHKSLKAGSWHHVAFAWQDDVVRLYVDGVELATGNSPGFEPPTGPIVIGCDSDGDYPFKGAIKAMRISRISRPHSYFTKLFPQAAPSMRLPELVLDGKSGQLKACQPPMHSNKYLLPLTKVTTTSQRKSLNFQAAPGQSESATFAIQSAVPLSQLQITPSDLTCRGDVISVDAIDIKFVKCVYHACEAPVPPNMIPLQSGKKPVPKLLVRDDALVKVDLKSETNAVRVFRERGRPRYYDATAHNPKLAGDHDIRDSRSLKPMNLPARLWQQLWVKINVSSDAVAGIYRGAIELKAPNVNAKLALKLRVLDLELPEPSLDYSMYYISSLVNRRKLSVQQRANGFAIAPGTPIFGHQMEYHLRDMKEHGVDNPIVTQQGANESETLRLFEQQLRIRRKVGMSTRRLYFHDECLVRQTNARQREGYIRSVRSLAEQYGYRDLACYVIDEPTLADLEEYDHVYRQLLDGGLKTFAAVDRLDDQDAAKNSPLWRKVKQCLSIVIVGGELQPVLAAAAHKAGMEVYSYGNPQVLSTEPETFRRNYGLALWKAGYDGAMDFAYNCTYGLSPWNDFDTNPGSDYRYRSDMGFAVTTSDGSVDTIAWEGFAAGVDDVRYACALQSAIEAAKIAGSTRDAQRAERWLIKLDISGDLDTVRRKIARMTRQLQHARSGTSAI